MHGFSTRTSPAGTYECRIAMNGAWGENYGEGGEWDGANIILDVTKGGSLVTFTYDS